MTVLPSLGQPEGGFSVLPKWTTETGDVVKGVFSRKVHQQPIRDGHTDIIIFCMITSDPTFDSTDRMS